MTKLSKTKQIFGTSRLDNEKLPAAIKAAGEAGYEVVDTAFFYDNEALVGKAVGEYNRTHKKPMLIQTKIWPDNYGDLINQLKKQLKLLGVKSVYSVLLHWPTINFYESIEAWKQLIKAKQQGLVEHIGVSNFEKDMIQILIGETGVMPEINQIELSVVSFRHDRVAFCLGMGIQVQGWRPMNKMGIVQKQKVVVDIAKKRKTTPEAVALAYLINQGTVAVVRSSNPEHIAHNWAANELQLTEAELLKLHQVNFHVSRNGECMIHKHSTILPKEIKEKYGY